MNFLEIKKRFKGFFDKIEPASAICWDILNIEQREDEPLEKYLARLQGMIMRAYPGSSQSEQDNTLYIEVFLKGCRKKGAVLAICDKKPVGSLQICVISFTVQESSVEQERSKQEGASHPDC